MPHDDTPADFHTHSHHARRRAGGEVRHRSIPSFHPSNREDASSREEAQGRKDGEPHDEMPSAEDYGEHEHVTRPLPPKPKRALLRHFSLSYTIVLLIAMGFVVAGATWVVVVTPRWLSEDSLAGDLSPEAQQILETVATSTATTTLAVSATTTPTTTPSVTPQKPRVRITETETGWLNVREGPSTTYRRLRQVLPGETYPFTEVRDGWYRIELGEGEYGWVSGTYVKELGAR